MFPMFDALLNRGISAESAQGHSSFETYVASIVWEVPHVKTSFQKGFGIAAVSAGDLADSSIRTPEVGKRLPSKACQPFLGRQGITDGLATRTRMVYHPTNPTPVRQAMRSGRSDRSGRL